MKTTWLEDEKNENICELCGKETTDTIRVKIEDFVYNVCKDCVEKNGYSEYDGSDVYSDWN